MSITLTPAGTQFLKLEGFTGHNGAGACTATGAKVGDLIVDVTPASGPYANWSHAISFESVVSVDDQIKQNDGGDYNALTFNAVLIRGVTPW